MATIVTIPRDRLTPPLSGDPKDEIEYLVWLRPRMEGPRAFVEDASAQELVNFGGGSQIGQTLPDETVARHLAAGLGTKGIFTVIEPADMDLYRSYVPSPLAVPEHPEVCLIIADYDRGNSLTRYQEGWVLVKAACPDGSEGWLVVSMPVPTPIVCMMGLAWGFPKYIADEMTVTPTYAEVRYEAQVRFSLELTPRPIENEKELRDQGLLGIENCIIFHPTRNGACPLHITRRGGREASKVVEWVPGRVKAYLSPKDPWSRLIPANVDSPGFYQRVLPVAGYDGVWRKIVVPESSARPSIEPSHVAVRAR